MEKKSPISKAFLYFLFIAATIAWQLALALVILLGALDYVGFDDKNPISATCTSSYFTAKEKYYTQMVKTSFISSIVGLLAFTLIFVFMLIWIVRVCREGSLSGSISRTSKTTIYLFTNIAILAEIPPCSYYLTHIVELNNCTSTYNATQIIIIFIIAALLFTFSFLYFVLIFWINRQQHSLE
jgi:hypothetical protein